MLKFVLPGFLGGSALWAVSNYFLTATGVTSAQLLLGLFGIGMLGIFGLLIFSLVWASSVGPDALGVLWVMIPLTIGYTVGLGMPLMIQAIPVVIKVFGG